MYRFIKLSCALVVAALAFVQCTKDLDEVYVGESQSASAAKIINSSRSAVLGTLLVEFEEGAALAFESGTRSAGVTRSNIEPLNDVLLDIDAISIERVFPVDVRNEEATRRAGLHCWYIVHFDKNISLDKVAKALAEIGEIKTIEFDRQIATLNHPCREGGEQAPLQSGDTRLSSPMFNDPLAGNQWDFHNEGKLYNDKGVAGMDINVREAWKYTTGDPSIIVAVIDQGVDYTHEDLKANMWVNVAERDGQPGVDDDKNGYVDDIHGYNFVDDGPISWDKDVVAEKDVQGNVSYGDIGHGTHIAGTIAAVNNNGIGICGIAGGDKSEGNGVKIMSTQIFSGRSPKNATSSVVAKAFKYAADNGAVLSNNSWGSPPSPDQNDAWFKDVKSLEYKAICEYFKSSRDENLTGGVAIFAAGNNGDFLEKNGFEQVDYPGAYTDFVSVTSFGIDGDKASYSNFGGGANIAAPGGNIMRGGTTAQILSTMTPNLYVDEKGVIRDSKYDWEQGTSMACPHVTGVAALGLAYAKKIGKKLTADEFISKLLVSVNDQDSYLSEKYRGKMGTGRIDAFKFLMNIEGITCIPVTRGARCIIDVNKYMGDGNTNIKLLKLNISSADMKSLGMSSEPQYLESNAFSVRCKNTGSAIVTVEMIAGGNTQGTANSVGGKVFTKKFALVVRDNFASNGGWL